MKHSPPSPPLPPPCLLYKKYKKHIVYKREKKEREEDNIKELKKYTKEGLEKNFVDNKFSIINNIVFPFINEDKGEIKGITSLVDPYPILDSSLWKLIQWMSTYYFTPIGQVAKTVLPKQLSLKYSPQKTWMVELKDCSEKNLINIDFSRSLNLFLAISS